MVKNPPANTGEAGFITVSGSSPGEGKGSPLQYSCLEVPWTGEPDGLHTVHGVAEESDTAYRLTRNVKEETDRAGLQLRPGCAHQATHMVTLPMDSELCVQCL